MATKHLHHPEVTTVPSAAASSGPVERVVGGDDARSLEHRIANGFLLLVAVITLLGALVNLITGVVPEAAVISSAAGILHALLYVWSRRRRDFIRPAWISLLVLSLVFYPTLWLYNYGVEGSMYLMGLSVMVAATSMFWGWRRNVVLGITVTMTVALFFFDYQLPGAFGRYETRGSQYIDVFLTVVLVSVGVVTGFLVMQSGYNRERKKNQIYAALIEETNRELQKALAQNRALAHTDSLTGLPNRRHLEALARDRLREAGRYERPLSLVLLDIDHFKSVNDSQGHAVGDAILREMGHLLRDGLRDTDTCARWGGEEFAVLCPETTLEGASVVAERLRRAVEAFEFAHQVTVSLGVASHRRGDSFESLFALADEALYAAKRAGRNRVVIAETRSAAPSSAEGERPYRPGAVAAQPARSIER